MSGDDRYFEVTGARLRYRVAGAGPAVVLIHGWTLDLDMWEPQVGALSNRLRVVRFDRRGFGLSSGIPGIAEDVADVRELCRHLGVTRAAFVGMSQGARVLERLIAVEADLVASVVFDGAPDLTPGGQLTSNDMPVAEYAALARSEGLEAFRRKWTAHPAAQLVTTDSQMRDLLNRMIARYPGRDLGVVPGRDATVGAFRAGSEATPAALTAGASAATPAEPTTGASAAAEAPADLSSIRVPVLIINGAQDLESHLAAGDLLVQRIPGAQRAVIAGAGHLPNLDNSAAYNQILQRFFFELAP